MEGRERLKIEWVDFFTTTECNLNCAYCFHKKNPGRMRLDHAKTYMDELLKICTDNMTINFFGGEPLLNPQVITFVVHYLQGLGKKFNYAVCTNGTIFDEKIFQFLVDNKFSIQISIDGDVETHDRYRGSHDEIVQNVWKMMEMGANVSARLTFTPETVDKLFDNISYLYKIGFKRITHQGTQEVKWDNDAIEKYKGQVDKLFNLSYNNPDLKLNFIDRAMKPCSEDGMICKAGKGLIAMLPNGDIYPCHRFVNSPEFKLGNIVTGFTRGIFLDITRDSLKKCRNCFAKSICHTCIASNRIMTGSMLEPSEDFCELIKYERQKGLQMDNKSLEQRLANIENMLLKLSVVILDLSEVIMEKTEAKKQKE